MKLAIWSKIPTHHNHALYEEISRCEGVEFRAFYYAPSGWLDYRKSCGWVIPELAEYESFTEVDAILRPELRDFIHIVPSFEHNGGAGRRLAFLASKHGLKWCHRGEPAGNLGAKIFNFNRLCLQLLNPCVYYLENLQTIDLIRKNAIFAFGAGLAADQLAAFGVPKEKIRLLPYSLPPLPGGCEPSKRITEFKNGRVAFFCPASLIRRKGQEYLLRAFSELPEALRSKSCVVLAGAGDPAPLMDICRRRGIADSVLFSGVCKSDSMGSLYAGCDCMVLPTLYDGWGVVLNEAASAGLPLISTDMCGAAWHLIDDGINGFRVPTKSVVALKKALAFYLENPDELKRHGEASRELFKKFTPQVVSRQLVECFR